MPGASDPTKNTPAKRWVPALAAGLALLVLTQFFAVLRERETYLVLSLSSSRPAKVLPLYLSSQGKMLSGKPHMVPASGRAQVISGLLPAGEFQAITLVMGGENALVQVHEIRLRNRGGSVNRVIPLPASRLRSQPGAELLPTPEGEVRLRVVGEEAKPALGVMLSGSISRPPISWWPGWRAWLAGLLGGGMVLGACELLRARGLTLAQLALRRPRAAVVLTGLAATAISLTPIFTQGRAFVGPYGGGALLYDAELTLPGQDASQPPPWGQGTDLASLSYSSLGLMHGAYEALGRGEIMLWDRFNSGGATYLGQGQFVYLCPYVWPVLLLGGSLASWTWAFVLAKLAFAPAMGLYLRRLGLNLWVVLGLTTASAFIGVFAYRAGHPAFFVAAAFPLLMLGFDAVLQPPAARWKRLTALLIWGLGCLGCFCSGSLKEAVFVLATGHFTVLGLRLVEARGREIPHLLGVATLAGLTLLLLLAPVWMGFLEALSTASTPYDKAEVVQQAAAGSLGMFDDLFARGLFADFRQCLPSLNLLFLPGVAFSLWFAVRGPRRSRFLVPLIPALICVALACEWLPGRWFMGIPFIKSLLGFYYVFGMAALPPLMVASALGWEAWAQAKAREKLYGLGLTAVLLGVGGLISLSQISAKNGAVLVGAALLLLGLAGLALLWRGRGRGAALALAGIAILLCARFVYTDCALLSPWSFVLTQRVTGDLSSPTTAWLREQTRVEPGRVVGLEKVLFPGFGTYYGLEGVAGAMPLRDPAYWEFLRAIPGEEIKWDWAFTPSAANLETTLPYLEFLNCRYLAAMPGQPLPPTIPPPVLERDLEVRALPGAWPRAFFVDRAVPVRGVAGLQRLVTARPGPFCAVEDPAILPGELPRGGAPKVVPARDYSLSLNNTAFTIDAPAAGIAVLHEVIAPGQFELWINGASVGGERILRVNHMFRGVYLPTAGTYRLEYRYSPPSLARALWLAGVGAVLLVALGGFLWLSKTASYGNADSPDPQPQP